MLELLQQRAADALGIATAKGAQDTWVSATWQRTMGTTLRDGALEEVQDKTEQSLRVRIYLDGRTSNHTTSDLRPASLQAFIQEAVALTKHLQPDQARAIPDPSLFAGRPTTDLDRVDPSVDGLAPDGVRDYLLQADNEARSDPNVISATSVLYGSHNYGAAISSNGFSGDWEGTDVWLGAEVSVQDGDARPEDSYWVGARHQSDLPDPAMAGRLARERAIGRLGSQKAPTHVGKLIIEPRRAGRPFRYLLEAFDGWYLQQKQSFVAGQLGNKLFTDALTLYDDPLLVRGLASRHFDREGISAQKRAIIDHGVVNGFYLDTTYAKKLGMAPTSGSQSNLTVALGSRSLEDIIADADEAILVKGWMGGNADSTTGDFSWGIRGHLVKNGEVTSPIGEMNITGNLQTLFANLIEVGNDPWMYGSRRIPTLVFDQVSFAGA